MIDTLSLYSLLENATTTEEEIFDDRFEEIVSLVDQEKLTEAASLITTIFNEGTIDIRLVMYLFYAQFMTQGITSLIEIFPAIRKIIEDHWDNISPIDMRDKHLLNSLTWFLSSIGKKLKRSEKLFKSKKADDFWNRSIQKLSPEEVEQLLQINQELSEYLVQKLEEPSLNQYIMFISKWIQNLKSVIAGDEPEERATPSRPEAPPKTPKKQLSLENVLASSEAMVQLFKKIQAFEMLIEKQEFEKAALISDDLALIIKSFDPSVFFPKLFSQYFALSAANIDSLSQEWENKGSLKWEALNRLYQTDLDEFIQW